MSVDAPDGRAVQPATMMDYYDRQGRRMSLETWATSFEKQDDKRVAETTLPNGYWVSTVWLGIDHGFGYGPPLIFETMVFESREKMSDLDCERYSTEAEALAGHAAMVEKWTNVTPVEEAKKARTRPS